MPNYNDLRPQGDIKKKEYALIFPSMKDADKKRTIENILRLREGLRNNIARKHTDANLLIAN